MNETSSMTLAGVPRAVGRSDARALAAMLTGAFLAIMDVMIVNVGLPSIRADLQASFAEAQLVIAAYGLSYALLLITGGRLGDLHGRRRMFLFGLAGFTLTSTLCGLAPTAPALVTARVLQGAAAALMFPQVLSLMRVTFTDEAGRARAFAALGVVAGLAGVTGQVLGGFIVEANLLGLGWRPLFLINLPVGLVGLVAARRFIAESRAPQAARLDLAGVLLGAAAFSCLLVPLIEGREAGWPAWSLALLAASVPLLALFARQQHDRTRRRASPLVDTGLFRDRAFTVGLLTVLAFYSTLNAGFLALAFFIQAGLKRSPFEAGLLFAVLAVVYVGASILAGRLPVERRRALLATGAAVTLVGFALAACAPVLSPAMPAVLLVPALATLGLGQGLFMTPLINTVISAIRDEQAGSAAGVLSTMQQVGGAIGVAVVGILFFGSLAEAQALGLPDGAAYGRALTAGLGYCVGALGVTLALLAALPRAGAAR